jgi:hypothetical protein
MLGIMNGFTQELKTKCVDFADDQAVQNLIDSRQLYDWNVESVKKYLTGKPSNKSTTVKHTTEDL